MINLKVPKNVFVVKSDKKMFGVHSSTFCFYDRQHASIVVRQLERNNMIVWNTPVNPTKFLLHPAAQPIARLPVDNYTIQTYESEPFFKEMLDQNISIRIIDNVTQVDSKTCSLSSFIGIDPQPTSDQIKTYLGNIYDKKQ